MQPSTGLFAPVDRRLSAADARREQLPDPLRIGAWVFGAVPHHPVLGALLERWRRLMTAPRPMTDLLEVSAPRLLSTALNAALRDDPHADIELLYPPADAPSACGCPARVGITPCRVGALGVYDHRRPGPGATPLVSCLCVTNNGFDHLSRAVRCFAAQTHPARELVIVYESDDEATIERVRAMGVPGVRCVRVPIAPKRSLGALRNLSLKAARGDFVTQWDDDDVYHPRRIEVQLAAAMTRGDAGNVLEQRLLRDDADGRAWLSSVWPFEGSILVRREVALDGAYLDRVRGEETDMVFALLDARVISRLRRPALYVYTYHGRNTFDRRHFEAIFAAGTPLDGPAADRLTRALERDVGSAALAEALDAVAGDGATR